MLRLAFLLPLLLPAVAPFAAHAQTRHNTNAPIDFGADQIQLQDRANRAVLTGNVSVKQAEMTLDAARMTVAYTGEVVGGNPQVSRLDASGGVTVRRPQQTARSQYAVYDLGRRVITMAGDVRLVQGAGNAVNGGRLTIDLDTGRATIDGAAARGGPALPGGVVQNPRGRVTGTFSVQDRK